MFHLVHLIRRGRKTLLLLTKPCRLMQLVRSTYITTSFPGFCLSRPTELWAGRREPWERGCVYQALDELDKNHRGKYRPDDSPGEGRMYERPKSPYCPVKTFELYLSKLNPSLSCLWQRPRARESFSERDEVWYCNAPLGKNTLATLMSSIAKEMQLSYQYTNNHCNNHMRIFRRTELLL